MVACSPQETLAPAAALEPVRAVDIAAGQQDEAVDVEVDGGEDGVGVTFREITIEPGASTGRHCHYGQLVAVVEQGELTHYAEIYPGGVHVYRTGDSIIEGAGYPHEGAQRGPRGRGADGDLRDPRGEAACGDGSGALRGVTGTGALSSG